MRKMGNIFFNFSLNFRPRIHLMHGATKVSKINASLVRFTYFGKKTSLLVSAQKFSHLPEILTYYRHSLAINDWRENAKKRNFFGKKCPSPVEAHPLKLYICGGI